MPLPLRQPPKKQQGVVIVVALFIVALVATMAYAMMARLARDTERTSLIVRNIQADFYAQGSVAWAIDQLKTDIEKKKDNRTVDAIPIHSPINDMQGYKIASTITDMQSRFNLNNLANEESQRDFVHLLRAVDSRLTEDQALAITKAIIDWITPSSRNNELMQYYAELPSPYRAAHRPMVSPTELRLVKGMTAELYNALQPFITALPNNTPINIQTASAPVLMTLSPTMTLETGKSLEQKRIEAPFVSAEIFQNLDLIKNHPVTGSKITTISQYFLVETTVSIENQRVVLYTLLQRAEKNGKPTVTILWQSKGTW